MAVTDLTGAGPTGGPAATPMGGDPSQPPPGVDPMQWLQYLYQMYNFGNPPPANGPGPGKVGPVPLAANGAQQGPPGYLGSQSALPPQGPPQSPTPWFTGGNTPMPWRGPQAPPGANPAPAAAAPAAAAPAAATPVPGPLAGGGASAVGATSNPRFVGLDYQPNASPQNSMRGGPQATALNLAGLFGGRGAVNPNAPAANAQPVSAVRGPLAQGGAPSGDNWDIDANGNVVPNYDTTSNAPWKYGPLQKGNIWKTSGGPRPRP